MVYYCHHFKLNVCVFNVCSLHTKLLLAIIRHTYLLTLLSKSGAILETSRSSNSRRFQNRELASLRRNETVIVILKPFASECATQKPSAPGYQLIHKRCDL